ncbi:MAG: hypothetical protein ACNI27_04025 [Desulfovibrio sp.]
MSIKRDCHAFSMIAVMMISAVFVFFFSTPSACAEGVQRLTVSCQSRHYVAECSTGRLFVVSPNCERQMVAEGLGIITGLGASRDGILYVASAHGDIYRICKNGKKNVVAEGLNSPSGIVVDRDGVVRTFMLDGKMRVVFRP